MRNSKSSGQTQSTDTFILDFTDFRTVGNIFIHKVTYMFSKETQEWTKRVMQCKKG